MLTSMVAVRVRHPEFGMSCVKLPGNAITEVWQASKMPLT
jgi:hypothetical protein